MFLQYSYNAYKKDINTTVLISEVDWKSASDGILKRYSYVYDPLNRLKDAIYVEPGSTVPHNNTYNENVTYDLNGNIKTLQRNAVPIFGTTSTMVDNLVYEYTGNRLDKVIENAMNDTGYEGGNNGIDYDDNGNMINMKDKGIQSIGYNFLSLPDAFDIVNTVMGSTVRSNLEYLYRADGTKLRKTYTSKRDGRGTVMTTNIVDYLDGFQYSYNDLGGSFQPCFTCKMESAYEEQAYKGMVFPGGATPEWKLDFVPTAEGFYSFTENRYIYQYKDHLGNARVSFVRNSAGAPEILDSNNYYPFGLNHTGDNGINNSGFGSWLSYKFNGKELQETGMYDFGARMYLSDLGRWGVIDPLAEQMRRYSPYNFAFNNPVSFIDPDGMAPKLHQFSMPGDSRPDAYNGGHNPNWLGLGNTGSPESGGYGGGNGYSVLSSLGNSNDYLLDELIAGWAARGIDAKVSKNGYLSYWTGGAEGYGNTLQEAVVHMINLSNSDGAEIRQSYHNFNPYKSDNTLEWYSFGGRANWGIATAATSLENFSGQARITTHGSSLKIYTPTAKGHVFIKNKYTRTTSISKIGKGLGTASFFLGVAFDGIGVINYMTNPNSVNAVHPSKAGLNTVMGYIGWKGGVPGAIISTLYFGIDNFYPGGWVGASETAAKTETYEQQMTGHPFFSNSSLKF